MAAAMSKTASNTPLPGFQYSRHQFEELVVRELMGASFLQAQFQAADQPGKTQVASATEEVLVHNFSFGLRCGCG